MRDMAGGPTVEQKGDTCTSVLARRDARGALAVNDNFSGDVWVVNSRGHCIFQPFCTRLRKKVI
jgi:hypothetical protein